MQMPFDFLDIPQTNQKPRETRITMMIDWGLGVQYQRDLLTVIGNYVDVAKIAVGTSGLMEKDILRDKLDCYKQFNILPFIGGQFLEYAIHHHGMSIADKYFEQARELGFEAIEVSDNVLKIERDDKCKLIGKAKEEFGFVVLGEVGSKFESSTSQALVKDIDDCLKAGAWKVFVEGAEIIDCNSRGVNKELIENIASSVNIQKIMFELPGIWIHDVHTCQIHDMCVYLIDFFGSKVNIANVMPPWVLELETLRCGVGVSGI